MSNESQKTFEAIRALALKDVDGASDEEMRAAFIEDGIEPDVLAAAMMTSLDDLVSASLRQQASKAKAAVSNATKGVPQSRPALARIKELIAEAFALDPQLAAAFRDGTRQSESDIQSMYDDLVLMGKISPSDDHGH